MKLVAVSVVKNEADIVEAFVRHTRAWVDHHLVFDHDSTDGTRDILGALQREGLPLSLFTDDALGNLQQARSNHLARLAAGEFGADWIIPLDADEAIAGPDRPALEKILSACPPMTPASHRLLNYQSTDADDTGELNPLLRLQHCSPNASATKKLLLPRSLVLDPAVDIGKGSHAVHRGSEPVADQPLPEEFHLAHFPLRSPAQQAMRIALAELQKLSRGNAHAGVDSHYRLGFQLLAANPELFFSVGRQPAGRFRKSPLRYCGGPLRYSRGGQDAARTIRALLPFLEKLAASHGELLDRLGPASAEVAAAPLIRPLGPAESASQSFAGTRAAFVGFIPLSGWEIQEGPVAEAYLPVFHWGLAPVTVLQIDSATARDAMMTMEVLTYSEHQRLSISLNGTLQHEHLFTRINQLEKIGCPLPLRAGTNRIELRYSESIHSAADPRKLAAIFLSLRIT